MVFDDVVFLHLLLRYHQCISFLFVVVVVDVRYCCSMLKNVIDLSFQV